MLNVAAAEAYFDYLGNPPTEMPQPEPQVLEEEPGPLAPLITVVSASGGVGRSSIALAAGMLAAHSGIDTVLIEGDLQFGDYGFWLGLDDTLPTLADANELESVVVSPNLELFKAPVFPEAAEEVTDTVARRLPRMRSQRGLAIADTGGFWSGLTANLVVEADLVLMVMNERVSSVAGALRASELCARLGVPSSRIVPVCNRWSSRYPLKVSQVSKAFDAPEVYCIPEAKRFVERCLASGDYEELVEQDNAFIKGMRELLTGVLPKVGHLYSEAPLKHRKGGFL